MKKTTISIVLVLAVVAVGYYFLSFTAVPQPRLPGVLLHSETTWDGYPRRYDYYVPKRLSTRPPLVFVFHGSMGDASQSRAMFGYGFEYLAEEHGFIVVYPEGYASHFNGCRAGGPYEANRLDIDDVGFMRNLVDSFDREYGIDRGRVFATGVSNGGQMALRLALEAPDLVTAVAPVATSMPAQDNMGCIPSGQPVAFLLMNGTDDPMNPYEGGKVALYGLVGDRGDVLSTAASTAYWADLAGYSAPPERSELPDTVASDGSSIEVEAWRAPGRKPVALYRVVGGGHTVPHPQLRAPRLIGNTNQDVVAAEVIWAFFARAAAE
ncbi:MAG: PHB depolymerase family esterase [Halioglobus sp.]|nr:PHB depolymerase family esterase [Halioglobus sp.]